MRSLLSSWDTQLFLKINALSDSKWDYLFGWPTFLGLAGVALPLVLILIWIWDQKNRILYRYCLMAASAAVSGLFVRILKNLILRDRPYHALYHQIETGVIRINCLFKMDISRSFPSGHSATVFALAVILNYLYGKRLWFLYPLAAWIAFTRIFVGAHYPADVLAGSLVGIISSLIIIYIVERWNLKPGGISWQRKA